MASVGLRRDRHDVVHRAEELASGLSPLLVAADRMASTVSQGVHGRRRVGQGETFWQFRRYQPGDATSRIDWRRSARSQRVYIRQTEWEAAQSVWLWRDASRSMEYRSSAGLSTKADRAELLLLALASLLIRGVEHLHHMTAHAPCGEGTDHGLDVVRCRQQVTEHDDARIPWQRLERGKAGRRCGGSLEPGGDPLEGGAPAGGRLPLAEKRNVLAPAEETLPFSGRVRFEGMEDDGEVLFGRAESVRDAYGAAVAAHRDALESLARTAGWTLLIHRTDRPPEPMMLALYLALAENAGA